MSRQTSSCRPTGEFEWACAPQSEGIVSLTATETASATSQYNQFCGLTVAQLPMALQRLSIPCPPEAANAAFLRSIINQRSIFTPRSAFLTLDEFLRYLSFCKTVHAHVTADSHLEETNAFAAMGGQSDRSGFLEQDKLQGICDSFGLDININRFMADFDEDGNGQIEFNEFIRLFQEEKLPLSVPQLYESLGAKPGRGKSPQLCLPIATVAALLPQYPVRDFMEDEVDDPAVADMELHHFSLLLKKYGKSAQDIADELAELREQAEREAEGLRPQQAMSEASSTPQVGYWAINNNPGANTTISAARLERKLARAWARHKKSVSDRLHTPQAVLMAKIPSVPRPKRPLMLTPTYHNHVGSCEACHARVSRSPSQQSIATAPPPPPRDVCDFLKRNYASYQYCPQGEMERVAAPATAVAPVPQHPPQPPRQRPYSATVRPRPWSARPPAKSVGGVSCAPIPLRENSKRRENSPSGMFVFLCGAQPMTVLSKESSQFAAASRGVPETEPLRLCDEDEGTVLGCRTPLEYIHQLSSPFKNQQSNSVNTECTPPRQQRKGKQPATASRNPFTEEPNRHFVAAVLRLQRTSRGFSVRRAVGERLHILKQDTQFLNSILSVTPLAAAGTTAAKAMPARRALASKKKQNIARH